jgi:hypothetical protein
MEIRIVGQGQPVAKAEGPARLVTASYAPGQSFGSSLISPTLASMLGAQQNANGDMTADGMIGYSQGQGAQALIPVPPSTPNAQFQLTKATTPDAQTVVVNYTVTSQLTSPIHFAVYRSPTQDTAPSSNQIAQCDVPSAGCTVGVAGSADSDPLAVGDHTVTLNPQAGLAPNTAFPYVVVVGTSGTQQQTTYFQKFLLGVVSHGFLPDQFFYDTVSRKVLGAPSGNVRLQPWETDMAASLKTSDGYDDAIPFDWTDFSGEASPSGALSAENKMVAQIVAWTTAHKAHAGDVVDLHFIAHSRGTVIVTQVIGLLSGAVTRQSAVLGADPKFGGGYVEVTLLDPHPANNTWEKPWADQFTFIDKNDDPLYSKSVRMAAGDELVLTTEVFQSRAADPQVVLPRGIKTVEVWYQHTSTDCLTGTEGMMNLWGVVGGQALVNSSGLAFAPVDKTTRPTKGGRCSNGIGHGEVPILYGNTVVKSGTLNRNTQWQSAGSPQ